MSKKEYIKLNILYSYTSSVFVNNDINGPIAKTENTSKKLPITAKKIII